MPTFGVPRPTGDAAEPMGYATLIPDAEPSIEGIDIYITGWTDPTHTLESQAGTEKIEDGATITDHVVAMPAKLTLTGWVSDIAQGSAAAAPAWEQIRKLQREETILRVVTEWMVYEEMFIAGANTVQDSRGMKFTLDLQEIVRVGLQQGDTSAIPRNAAKDSPADGRSEEVEQGRVAIPGVDLGDGRFLTGTPDSPNRKILTRQPDGTLTSEPYGE